MDPNRRYTHDGRFPKRALRNPFVNENNPKLMKTQKRVTKRIYPALALLALGGFTLFQAVQADPAAPQPRTRPGPQDVSVVNPTSNPVPVRDVDNAARQPFQTDIFCGFNGSDSCSGTITVPSGKELVIEFVSIDLSTDSGVMSYSASLEVQQGCCVENYSFPLALQIDTGTAAEFVGVHQTRLYADPSGRVGLSCKQSRPSSLGGCIATISGYLVDVP